MIMYKGRRFSVVKSMKALPNGLKMGVESVVVVGGITILPVNGDKIVLIRQYRPVIGKWIYELPAGGMNKRESHAECARRELKEETGFTAKRMEYLFTSLPTPGMSTERMHVFMASGLRRGRQELDKDEVIKVHEFTLKQVLGMIRAGRIIDGKTIEAILYYARFED